MSIANFIRWDSFPVHHCSRMNLVVKNLAIISLNLFGFALRSPALLHGQISGRRNADPSTETLSLFLAEYFDWIQAVWTAQMIAQRSGGRFEHQPRLDGCKLRRWLAFRATLL
jgi:hypothetical protein